MNKYKLQQSEINFRRIAQAEGISYLTLLGIAMPLKYLANLPIAVDILGWIHGILFITYICSLTYVSFKINWKFKRTLLAGLVSLLPFGPFLFDKKIFANQ